ncbi:energy-coupling factor transporter transmembrane protein EcfT [Paenalkalicoccus suaedae]|uniref:Energy-coupling factor transporter transmembrane protein EcfT n=1 Tax=Paenalkalicoccus suaedae TaxID=2592382 RepID=A0A859FBN3_9BACI|nr:energy-coupling factor transporter transmembrane protein EcfT [Paenalkalicoccus suaedae]QKS69705.1 energy-coupling factor transporter transmembrane protein EcfT [Paenalkalicoccus suaedae]
MLDNIIIGQYVPRDSIIHRLDPRSKFLCVLIFMVFIFTTRDAVALTVGATITTLAVILANVPWRFFLKGLRFIFILILITGTLQLLLNRTGTVLVDAGFITIYTGGVIEGALIAFRLLMLIVTATLLTLTTPPIDLTDGLERLLSPAKRLNVPTHELALMMSIALRFIPTLLGETSKIIHAQMARGAAFVHGSIWQRLKAVTPILIPLFVQSFQRAEDLATAMEARGYEGGDHRTKYRELTWQTKDTIALAIYVGFALITIMGGLLW